MSAKRRKLRLWVGAILLAAVLFVVGYAVLTLFQHPGRRLAAEDISFAQLLDDIDHGRVRSVVIQGGEIQGTYLDGLHFKTYAPRDPALLQQLRATGVVITAQSPSQ
jgi:cell division protease FtsH